MNTRDFNNVLICAIRYCLGRQTYMPSLVMDFIRENKEWLELNTVNIMLRDIKEFGEWNDGKYGMECDTRDWLSFIGWLESEKASGRWGEQDNSGIPTHITPTLLTESTSENIGGKTYTVRKGKWKINCDGYYPYCSVCGSEPEGREKLERCPSCGAFMED